MKRKEGEVEIEIGMRDGMQAKETLSGEKDEEREKTRKN